MSRQQKQKDQSCLEKVWDAKPKKIRQTSLTHWTTQDGKRILIKKLKSPHLLNILKLLIRVACNRKVATELLYLRPPFGGPTGEMAQDCFEREFDQVMDMTVYDYLPPIWDELEAEATKRNLVIPKFPNEDMLSMVALNLAIKRK